MKKSLIITALALGISQMAKSQFSEDGFYRVQNCTTDRYLSIVDDKCYNEVLTTSPDMYALRSIYSLDKVLTDPSTVFYIKKNSYNTTYSADVCNIYGQGTDLYKIISHYLYIRDQTNGTGNKYRAFAIESGVYYLCDNNGTNDNGTVATNKNNKDWRIFPFGADKDCYFGVKPTVVANGRNYATMYCGFGYKPYSAGVKSYVVDRIWKDKVIIREVEGTVSKLTPVIIECGSSDYVNNRLDFTLEDGSKIDSNLLKGVMFNIYYRDHNNRVLNDPNTIRVLGVCSDGQPGFVTKSESELVALPANTAYLKVPAGSPAELPLMSYEEYTSGINGVEADNNTSSDVVSLSGVTVRKNAVSLDGLPSGVYIWNKKKIVID
ncbi:MAG: hypothetical protein SOZ58_07915 [Prevotella sp.]|nr:hypothetical protein [Prevotella sp.]